jgi:hypothetical protein
VISSVNADDFKNYPQQPKWKTSRSGGRRAAHYASCLPNPALTRQLDNITVQTTAGEKPQHAGDLMTNACAAGSLAAGEYYYKMIRQP